MFVRSADPCRPGPGAPIAAQAPAAAQAATEYRDRSRSCPALVGSVGPRRAKVDRAKGSCRRFPSPTEPAPADFYEDWDRRPCAAGYGVRGGTSRGAGSGSRYLKVVCQVPGCGYQVRVARGGRLSGNNLLMMRSTWSTRRSALQLPAGSSTRTRQHHVDRRRQHHAGTRCH